jgi:hypothetical protein
LHRQVGRHLTLEDAIRIYRRLSEQVGQIDAVGYQAAFGDGGTQCMDHRQAVARRQLVDQLSVGIGGGVRYHNHSEIRIASPLGHRGF